MTEWADAKFVELTTYRRNGVGVPTPVWIAGDGDELVVTTGAATGKVKRIRNNPEVVLRPCTRLGKVDPDAPSVRARAAVVTDQDAVDQAHRRLRAKYGLQFPIFLRIEKLFDRTDRERAVLRLTLEPPS